MSAFTPFNHGPSVVARTQRPATAPASRSWFLRILPYLLLVLAGFYLTGCQTALARPGVQLTPPPMLYSAPISAFPAATVAQR